MRRCQKNILDQKTHAEYLKLQIEPYIIGMSKVCLKTPKQKEDTEDIYFQMSLKNLEENKNLLQMKEEKSVIVEYQPEAKKKIWKDKSSSLKNDILITKLSQIMDQALTSKEKVLTPFWNQQSKEISEKLWLPTKIDYVDSVLSSSKESLLKTTKGKSWFSINKKHPHKKSSLATSFQSSLFSHPESMDSEVTQSKSKSETKQLKTLKIRLFPTENEKKQIQLEMEQFRWYYNSIVTIVYNHYGYDKILDKKKYSNYKIRDLMRKYEYVEETYNNLTFKDFVFDEERNQIPEPEWWKGKNKVHSRLPRGAVDKFVSSLNSAITNYNNGNVSKFEMKFMTKKKPTEYLHFEDKSFPAYIRDIKSKYWFTTKDRKRKYMSFADIFKQQERGIEIIYEKETNKYFLHYPIESDWFPSDDKRIDNQNKYITEGDRIISLDPGIRKFLVGYDPTGYSVFIGEGAGSKLADLLIDIDEIESIKSQLEIRDNYSYRLWKKVKNLVEELHWKTISFLVENYDTIILPDFRVSQMIKSRKLTRMVKRLMCMFSFNSFKEKLKYKCSLYNKKLIIVDESYTSCTCGVCGLINDTKGKEIFSCNGCGLVIDRDATGARNIFIKNSTLTLRV